MVKGGSDWLATTNNRCGSTNQGRGKMGSMAAGGWRVTRGGSSYNCCKKVCLVSRGKKNCWHNEKVKKSKGSGRYGTYGRVQRYMNMYIFEYACAHVSAVHVTMSRSHLSHRLVHHRVELLLLKHCSLPRLEFSHPSVQPWLHSTK